MQHGVSLHRGNQDSPAAFRDINPNNKSLKSNTRKSGLRGCLHVGFLHPTTSRLYISDLKL
jgi:hypothetical protein